MTEPQSVALNQSIGKIKLSRSWRSADLHIPSRDLSLARSNCAVLFFCPSTQLSSLRNEVCCAGILFAVHSPSCSSVPICQSLKTKHFSSASHPRWVKLPSHYSHSTHKSPSLFTQERTDSSSWSQKTPNPPSRHSPATHWAEPQSKLTFHDQNRGYSEEL